MKYLLLLLCACTLILFSDRGAISCSSISGSTGGIPTTFNLSLAAASYMYAASMIGLTIGSLLAGQAAKITNALRLIGIGLLIFSLGCIGMASSVNYPLLLVFRALVGAASGPFISVASPLINDHSAASKRSLSLACLFLCMPLGFSLGYISGSSTAETWGWRSTFLIQAVLMLPLAVGMLVVRNPPDIHRTTSSGGGGSSNTAVEEDGASLQEPLISPNNGNSNNTNNNTTATTTSTTTLSQPTTTTTNTFLDDLNQLSHHPLVLLLILGVAFYNGSLSSFGFYGSKAFDALYHVGPDKADMLFGLLGILMGTIGSISGGLILDAMGANVVRALMVCTVAVFVAAAAVALAFVVARSFFMFAFLAAIAEGAIFSTSAPVMAALLWSTPPNLRPFALGISEVCTHLIGDVPLPPLLGIIQSNYGDWRLTMGLAAAVMAVAGSLFWCAWCLAANRRGLVVSEHVIDGGDVAVVEDEGDIEQPLLRGDGRNE